MVGVKKSTSASHSYQTLLRAALKLTRTPCCIQKSTAKRFNLHEKLFLIIHTCLLEFNMVGVRKGA